MKIKSISVQDFGNIVKEMINGALEDDEQVGRFNKVIYDEWFFNKFAGLTDIPVDDDESKILHGNEENISATVTHHRIRRKYKYCDKEDSQTSVNSEVSQEIEQIDENSDTHEIEDCTKKSQMLLKIEDKGDVKAQSSDKVQVIEIWNNSTQKPKVKEPPNVKKKTGNNQGSPKKEQTVKGQLSFTAWKKKKNAMYQQMLKESKQAELEKLAMDMERKKIAEEKQARLRQKLNHTRNKKSMQNRQYTMKQWQITADEILMRRMINDRAFEAWKKRKDMESREEKMLMRPFKYLEKQTRKEKLTMNDEKPTLKFNTWLNQLDWILHQKYLRERRHLVRSFYCQPVYYGDSALCAR